MRIGITSGEVVAGDTAGRYDVIGDAANTAARLQGKAAIGGVLVVKRRMLLARRRRSSASGWTWSWKGRLSRCRPIL